MAVGKSKTISLKVQEKLILSLLLYHDVTKNKLMLRQRLRTLADTID